MEYFMNFIPRAPEFKVVGIVALLHGTGPCCRTVQLLKCLLTNSQPCSDPSGRTEILTPCLGIALQKHHV